MTASQPAPANPPVLTSWPVHGPPLWVEELPGLRAADVVPGLAQGLELRLARGESLSRLHVGFDGVRSMDILTFQQTVAEAYRSVFRQLTQLATPHPIRFWAFVPNIHADLGAGLDRYMAFNAGRYAAYAAWCGGRDAFSRSVATGSAVGVGGDRLELHCLASCEPGTPVENPRQVPAYRYSRRYGPLPPCFARATSIGAGALRGRLLVGGTASIRGEDSLHVGDVREQTLETLRNLASVVSSACGAGQAAGPVEPELSRWLSRFCELRVYRPRPADSDAILELLRRHFAGVTRFEVLQAELCRAELLVELEGLADIGARPAGDA
jgi:chorismate lyase/3-hydroxybenzoate synthase